MEKETARKIDMLEKYGFPNATICAFITKDVRLLTEYELCGYQEARDRELERIEKEYYDVEWPKVQANIKAMIEEIPESERKEVRRRHLLEKLKEAKKNLGDPRIKQLIREIAVFNGNGFTESQIERASTHPLEKLIKNAKGMAVCPFHPDKTPSMDIRKGFFYCYGCGEHGNAINLLMKRDGITFPEAVEKLT